MKIIRRIFTIGIILILLFAAGSFVFIKLYGEEIRTTIISALNDRLNTKVDVADVDFNFWDEFPSAALSFKEVTIYSSINQEDTLISAAELNTSFNLIKFYKKDYELTGISLKNGICTIEIDKQGRANYLILKSDTSAQSKFRFVLSEVNFDNIDFAYNDLHNQIDLSFELSKGQASGNFTDSIYALKLNAEMLSCNLNTNGLEVIKNRAVHLNGVSQINDVLKTISFSKTVLSVEDFDLKIDGVIDYKNKTKLDLGISTENQNLKSAISVLPEKIKLFLEEYKIEGEAYVSGFLKGEIGNGVYPSYSFNFDLKNGDLSKKDGSVAFNNTFMKGSIENGALNKLESTKLSIERFKSNMLNGNLMGSLLLENFKTPKYEFAATANLELSELISFLKLNRIKNSAGKIHSSFNIKGKMRSIDHYDLSDFKMAFLEGKVNLEGIEFDDSKSDYSVKQLSGDFKLRNNQTDIDSISLSLNGQNLIAGGRLINLLPFTTEKNERLIADINLISAKIDLDQFASKANDDHKFSLIENVTIYLNSHIKELKSEHYVLNNFKSDVFVNHEKIDVRDCSFETLGGIVEGDFFLKKANKGYQFLSVSKLKKVNIKQLFKAFKNFEQTTVVEENISGELTADIHTNVFVDENLKVQLPSLKVDADFLIENGRLQNVKALEAFSKHIDLNELQDISFKTIQNQIYIEKENLFIPKMTIYSSAIELSMYGNHSFNNDINYHFVLLLNEILGKKVKRPNNNEFGYVEDDGLGRTKIFVKMEGTVDDPQISYDSKELKKHLQSEVQTEKKTIKKLLNEEFGLFKKDTTYKDIELSKSPKKSPFTIEWDEKQKKVPETKKNSRVLDTNKSSKKGKFGKFIDKIAKPNEDEFVEPPE